MTVKKECITIKGEQYFIKIKKKELNILQQSERERGRFPSSSARKNYNIVTPINLETHSDEITRTAVSVVNEMYRRFQQEVI